MKPYFVVIFAAALLNGCANFTTEQKDISYDPVTGAKTREITTDAKAATFWDSTQLTQWKARQTDKDQGASVGNSQESSSTNIVNLFEAVARGAAQGATKVP